MFAAGLTMKIENVRAFSERFEEIVTKVLASRQQLQTIEVDAKISLHEITPRFFRIMKQFAPFGPHNMIPVFVSEDVIDAGSSRLVGKNLEHIKLDLMEPDASSGIFAGIAFNMASKFPIIQSGMPFDICYSIALNEFRGKTNLQLNIKDIKTKGN
jgi:single-stranded-DNA-specific exonuclease